MKPCDIKNKGKTNKVFESSWPTLLIMIISMQQKLSLQSWSEPDTYLAFLFGTYPDASKAPKKPQSRVEGMSLKTMHAIFPTIQLKVNATNAYKIANKSSLIIKYKSEPPSFKREEKETKAQLFCLSFISSHLLLTSGSLWK